MIKCYPQDFSAYSSIKGWNQLKTFLEKTADEDFINRVIKRFSDQPTGFEKRFKCFQEDIFKNISSVQKKEVKNKVGIFYLESSEGLHALISPRPGEAVHNLATVLGNLGYSPDSLCFLRNLISSYPSFFPAGIETSFLTAVMQVNCSTLSQPMNTLMAGPLQALSKPLELNINRAQDKANPVSDDAYQKLANHLRNMLSLNNSSEWFVLYQGFLKNLLGDILKNHNESQCAIFAVQQMADHVAQAIRYNENIPLFIRSVQNIMEAWMLYIAAVPIVEDPLGAFRDSLPQAPTLVHITPYAMRSFTRVLQALLLEAPINAKKPLSIQVFNQSYFELINNMERLRTTAKVILSQSDNQIEDCDLYFIDIHPNNAVEKHIFEHNIADIIARLAAFGNNKPRTLVVDITLCALSAPEVKKLLEIAQPHYNELGWLNLVLIQSLTKFAQLGFDKLSAGLLAGVRQTCDKLANSIERIPANLGHAIPTIWAEEDLGDV